MPWQAASEVVGLFPQSMSAEPPPLPLDGLAGETATLGRVG